MENTIWKYKIETTETQIINMPVGAKILTIQTQVGNPCMWVMVDPDAEIEHRTFEIFGTGQKVNYETAIEYIGTYQLRGGSLVFHVFERIN